jgi:transcription antitermination factor NusA-like protein
MLKIGIKYCGGCNPYYDRVALVQRIESRLQGKAEFVSPDTDSVDLVLAVEGCKTACADLGSFDGKEIRVITQDEDVEEFIQEILG